jgi:hypothetical protein
LGKLKTEITDQKTMALKQQGGEDAKLKFIFGGRFYF